MMLKFNEYIKENFFWGKAGAGILPICKTTGNILVSMRSAYVNEPNTYGVVGGKIDTDDLSPNNVKSEALRELKEETGYRGHMEIIDAFIYSKNDFKYFNFIGIVSEEFNAVPDWENEFFEWVSFDDLIELEPKHFGLVALLNDIKSLEIIKKYSK